MRLPPTPAKHRIGGRASKRQLCKEALTLRGKNDVTWLAALGPPNVDRAAVRVEVAHLQLTQLAPSAASFQRALHNTTKVRIAAVDQPLRFGDREIADARGINRAGRA